MSPSNCNSASSLEPAEALKSCCIKKAPLAWWTAKEIISDNGKEKAAIKESSISAKTKKR